MNTLYIKIEGEQASKLYDALSMMTDNYSYDKDICINALTNKKMTTIVTCSTNYDYCATLFAENNAFKFYIDEQNQYETKFDIDDFYNVVLCKKIKADNNDVEINNNVELITKMAEKYFGILWKNMFGDGNNIYKSVIDKIDETTNNLFENIGYYNFINCSRDLLEKNVINLILKHNLDIIVKCQIPNIEKIREMNDFNIWFWENYCVRSMEYKEFCDRLDILFTVVNLESCEVDNNNVISQIEILESVCELPITSKENQTKLREIITKLKRRSIDFILSTELESIDDFISRANKLKYFGVSVDEHVFSQSQKFMNSIVYESDDKLRELYNYIKHNSGNMFKQLIVNLISLREKHIFEATMDDKYKIYYYYKSRTMYDRAINNGNNDDISLGFLKYNNQKIISKHINPIQLYYIPNEQKISTCIEKLFLDDFYGYKDNLMEELTKRDDSILSYVNDVIGKVLEEQHNIDSDINTAIEMQRENLTHLCDLVDVKFNNLSAKIKQMEDRQKEMLDKLENVINVTKNLISTKNNDSDSDDSTESNKSKQLKTKLKIVPKQAPKNKKNYNIQ